MIILDTTSRTLEAVMLAAVTTTAPDFVVSWADHVPTYGYLSGASSGALNGTTAVAIVGAPAASAQRQVKTISLFNRDSVAVTIRVRYDVSGVESWIYSVALDPNWLALYTDEDGWQVYDTDGVRQGGGGGGGGNAFGVIQVSGEPDITAGAASDPVEFEAGTNVTITNTPGSPGKVRFDVSSSGGSGNVTSETAYASPPGTPIDGDLNFNTDAGAVRRADSSLVFIPYGAHNFRFEPPDATALTWLNQGGATVDNTYGPLYLTCPTSAAFNIRGLYMAAPATPYTLTAVIETTAISLAFHTAGLFFRESGTGELHTFGLVAGTNTSLLESFKANSATSPNITYQARGFYAQRGMLWMRIEDNGTNRICSISIDGQHWHVFHTIGRTDFLTANQIGIFGNVENTSYNLGVRVPHLKLA